jgi:hypothetical protein
MRALLACLPSAGACALPQQQTGSSRFEDPLTGFEWRRVHSANGIFLRGDILRSVPDALLDDVLRMRIPGYRGQRAVTGSAMPSCSVDGYVNGHWSGDVLGDLRTRDVEAIEYYQAATAPQVYRRSGHACPVLVVWLRR